MSTEIPARRVLNYSATEKAGDFFLTPSNNGVRRLSFLCPCGCGILAGIKVRDDGKMLDGAWAWDRNEEKPTCAPSINIMGDRNDDGTVPSHWHGYLTNGVFRSC